MATQRWLMRKIRDVLRLQASGLSKRQIAASLSLGPTEVVPHCWTVWQRS